MTTKVLELADVVDFLHPMPGPMLLRLVASGAASSSEEFARLYGGRWELQGAWWPGKGPGLPEWLAENRWGRCQFAPSLCIVPNASEVAASDVVAVRFPLQLIAPERLDAVAPDSPAGFGSYDDMATMRGRAGLVALEQKRANDTLAYASASAVDVMDRLRGLSAPPSLLVSEGDAVVAVWRLSERHEERPSPGYRLTGEGMPVTTNIPASRFTLLHHRLALNLGGDVNAAARMFMFLIDCPGTRRQDISNGRGLPPVVTAEIVHENTFTLEQLEELAIRKG